VGKWQALAESDGRTRTISLSSLRADAIGMPRKIREPIRDLERAGFANRGGKGSHRNYEHPAGVRVTVSGRLGDDARP
jgi:predicted RNA binding protein YcfA (HicA-like mRNA interferase family)